MTLEQATAVAQALGGEVFHSGGGVHLVRFPREDGGITVLDENGVCAYRNDQAMGDGNESAGVTFR